VCLTAGTGKPRVVKGLLPDSVRRRFDPGGRYGLRITLFAFALVLVAVPFGVLLQQVVSEGPLLRVDHGVANSVHEWVVRRGPGFVDAVRLVSWLGRPPFLSLVAVLVCAFLLRRGRTRLAIFVVTTAIMGGLVDTAVKNLVHRPRPVFDHPVATAIGKSFPSGHSMSSAIVYGSLLLVLLPAIPRRRRPWAIGGTVLLVLTIAASRIALGVHFLSDVVGGLVLGVAWLAASVAAFRIWRTERGRKPTPVAAGLEPEAARDLKVGAGT
jgi:undecaprenyl-diphosphatase